MTDYYAKGLAGERLDKVYRIATPRVQQYLEAEIEFVLDSINPGDHVLEPGCGTGRVTRRLADKCGLVVGIDNAFESLRLAEQRSHDVTNCRYFQMDAAALGFVDHSFDSVAIVQNGICAFRIDPKALITEALRVTRPEGFVLLSTYTDSFWPHRLEWFEAQADAGLLGPIDYEKTGDGVIACTDGFRSGRMTPGELTSLCESLHVSYELAEVDDSSLFCCIWAHRE